MRKPMYCICENKDAYQLRGISFAVTAKLISDFVFTTGIVQSLFFMPPTLKKLEGHIASGLSVCLSVCVCVCVCVCVLTFEW